MSHLQIVPIIHKPEKESKGYEWENEMTLSIGTTSTSPSNTGKTSHHRVIFDINPTSHHTTGHYQLHQPCSVTGQALRGPEYRRRGTQHGQPWTVLNCKSLKAMVGHLQSLSNLLFAEHVPNLTDAVCEGTIFHAKASPNCWLIQVKPPLINWNMVYFLFVHAQIAIEKTSNTIAARITTNNKGNNHNNSPTTVTKA